MYKLWKSNSNYKFEFKKFFVSDNTNVSLDTYMTTEINIDAKCRVIQTSHLLFLYANKCRVVTFNWAAKMLQYSTN